MTVICQHVLASVRPPSPEEVKKLTVTDIAIMSGLADSLKDRLEKYIEIDPYTMPDPLSDRDDYNYSVIIDREAPNRVVAMTATKKDALPQLPWNKILGERLIKLQTSKLNAAALKYEMMPKDTNNFYPYRRSGKITGCIMFAFQICGQH
jgi:hypothetical protein